VKAGKLRALGIILKSIAVTLWITVTTVSDVYRGRYRREVGDRRLRWWSERLLCFVQLSVRVVNPRQVAIPAGRPCILMCNHSSLYDVPITFQTFPGSIRMLTKKELFRVPIWGRGLRAGEFVSIDRDDREQAFRDLEAARAKMESGIVLWVAPEGTRSRDRKLGSFKKGGFMLALRTGATILPFGIRGASRVLPPKTLDFNLGETIEVHVGTPVDASRFTVETRDALMREVEAQLRELAGMRLPS
jgi:1-acyl-sn-glycerol-3-phosphate acyltransferase